METLATLERRQLVLKEVALLRRMAQKIALLKATSKSRAQVIAARLSASHQPAANRFSTGLKAA